ncbi:hypothetical protein E4631_18995 [Hymenobacter sp. UV11]|uniref:hypothetical protein n=1 Tax=Hymenobacter sp. UV11 TaxID=1849735 RepID=UPI00105B4534|nr:hypothetical protein [Hymenobacter sp. UV11]TDN36497.1 hypothetical protein A8B98_09095 [Hymenobacter sp. UV11]TFZ64601.1 hypothetical protein E4631_18995 [Hymenobacter sp. UV11]
MASFLQALTGYSATVLVNTSLHDGGFALTGPGILGTTIVTAPGVTQQILSSPEFDQLMGNDKAARILEIVLAQAAQ